VVAVAQWSFRNTRTTGTLTSQAETGVWVQAPAALSRGSGGISSRGKIEIVMAKSRSPVHFGVLKHFNTMGTPFQCVPAAFQQWEGRSHASPSGNEPCRDPVSAKSSVR